ncbi:hypothetical protein DFH27DRAFT_565660 [Peziza echinospora]|nr:hypothetical protein DFH27DRAFT_565660 [Peziza echinospora]
MSTPPQPPRSNSAPSQPQFPQPLVPIMATTPTDALDHSQAVSDPDTAVQTTNTPTATQSRTAISLEMTTAHPLLTPARLADADAYLAAIAHLQAVSPIDRPTRGALLALAMFTPHAPLLRALALMGRTDLILLGLLTMLGLDALRGWGGGVSTGGKRKGRSDEGPPSHGGSDADGAEAPEEQYNDEGDGGDGQSSAGALTTIELLRPVMAHPLLAIAQPIPPELVEPAPRGKRPRMTSRLRALLLERHANTCTVSGRAARARLHGAHVVPYSMFYGPRRGEAYGWAFLAVLIGERARDAVFAEGYARPGEPDAAAVKKHLRNMLLLDSSLHQYFDAGTVGLTPIPPRAQTGELSSHLRDYKLHIHVNLPTGPTRHISLVRTAAFYQTDDLRSLTTTLPKKPSKQYWLVPAAKQTSTDPAYQARGALIEKSRPMEDGDVYRLGTTDPTRLPLLAGKMMAVRALAWNLILMVDMAGLRAGMQMVIQDSIVGRMGGSDQGQKRSRNVGGNVIKTVISGDESDDDDAGDHRGSADVVGRMRGGDMPAGNNMLGLLPTFDKQSSNTRADLSPKRPQHITTTPLSNSTNDNIATYQPDQFSSDAPTLTINSLTHEQHLCLLQLLLPRDLWPSTAQEQWEKALERAAREPWTRAMRTICRNMEEGEAGRGGYADRAAWNFWSGEEEDEEETDEGQESEEQEKENDEEEDEEAW